MTEPPAIELRDVTVVYNEGTLNEVVALKNISLTIARGETVIIRGGNGSGKSTLLKAIAGTAPLQSGSVWLHGQDVTKWPPYKRARILGFVHQDPMLGTCPNLTVHENFQLTGDRNWWLPAPVPLKTRERDLNSIQKTGLPLESKACTPVSMLSGGQRQAITLCLAFGSSRTVFLLDEFTSALDMQARSAAASYLSNMADSREISILAVMHGNPLKFLREYKFVLLGQGKIINCV